MNVLDLFSGIGGFSLGLERAGFKTVAFCEIDDKCRKVLKARWPNVPIYRDVRALPHIMDVDVITAGFPCQPFSTAARGRNNATDLWPYAIQTINRIRPRWVIAENVPGIGNAGIDRVCSDLEGNGYTVWTFNLDSALPSRQRGRHRIFWLAHSDSEGQSRRTEHGEVACLSELSGVRSEDIPAPVGMDDGLPGRMDRLRMLGNAVTPFSVEIIGRAIMAAEISNGHVMDRGESLTDQSLESGRIIDA